MKIFKMAVIGNWYVKVICTPSQKVPSFENIQIYISAKTLEDGLCHENVALTWFYEAVCSGEVDLLLCSCAVEAWFYFSGHINIQNNRCS
jgi:hypothetical protein